MSTNNALFDTLLRENAHLRNDAGLARALNVAPPVISKIRHGSLIVGDTMRLTVMRKFQMPLYRLDELAPPKGEVK